MKQQISQAAMLEAGVVGEAVKKRPHGSLLEEKDQNAEDGEEYAGSGG